MFKKFNELYSLDELFNNIENKKNTYKKIKNISFFNKEFELDLEKEIFMSINARKYILDKYSFINLLHSSFINKVYSDLVSYNTIIDNNEKDKLLFILLQLTQLEKVFILNSNEMFNLKLEQLEIESDNQPKKENFFPKELRKEDIKTELKTIRNVELMGCYLHNLSSSKILVDIYKKILYKESEEKHLDYKEEDINEYISKINNIICLCPENMDLFIDSLNEEEQKLLPFNKLINLVFSHELGHLVFDSINLESKLLLKDKPITIREKQANLISSYLYNGFYDKEIKLITDNQLAYYKNPILCSLRLKNKLKYDVLVNDLY